MTSSEVTYKFNELFKDFDKPIISTRNYTDTVSSYRFGKHWIELTEDRITVSHIWSKFFIFINQLYSIDLIRFDSIDESVMIFNGYDNQCIKLYSDSLEIESFRSKSNNSLLRREDIS